MKKAENLEKYRLSALIANVPRHPRKEAGTSFRRVLKTHSIAYYTAKTAGLTAIFQGLSTRLTFLFSRTHRVVL